MNDLETILRNAGGDLVELLPYFFLAIIIGASVDILCLDVVARRSFKKHGLLGILFTTVLGAFSPFCSFTVIPLIRKLLRGGVPLSAVMAFWIASPAMDPPIFALTAKQIGLPLATARLVGALILSIGAGLIILILERRGMFRDVLRRETDATLDKQPAATTAGEAVIVEEVEEPVLVGAAVGGGGTALLVPAAPPVTLIPDRAESVSEGGCGQSVEVSACGGDADTAATGGACATACGDEPVDEDNAPWWPAAKASLQNKRNWKLTARNIFRDSISLGKWLVFACIFEGFIRVFVPTSFVTGTLGSHVGLLAIPLGTFVSVPLYLNGVGAIPIVGGLLAKGMATGAAISFLLGGAVTTIPAMVAVRSVVNNRVFAVYLTIGIVGSILLGFAAQLVL
jgi:uncharacterized protein